LPWKVDIGVACNKWQSPSWWGKLIAEALRAVVYDNVIIGHTIFAGGAMTDIARNHIAAEFLKGESEWLFQFDDDTVPPPGTMSRLLSLQTPISSGVYFSRADVKKGENPIPLVYRLGNPEAKLGEYVPIIDYYYGEIFQADATGMGCSLIHRSVFEAIQDHYVLLQRPTGPLLPVAPEDVERHAAIGLKPMSITSLSHDCEYPFFLFDNARTEDFFFYELVRPLGYRVLVDTKVECQHISSYAVDGDDFWPSRVRSLEGHDEIYSL
jgi:hypothetical protein